MTAPMMITRDKDTLGAFQASDRVARSIILWAVIGGSVSWSCSELLGVTLSVAWKTPIECNQCGQVDNAIKILTDPKRKKMQLRRKRRRSSSDSDYMPKSSKLTRSMDSGSSSGEQPEEEELKKKKRAYNTSRSWKCKKCNETFKLKKLLQAHRKIKHYIWKDSNETHTYRYDHVQEIYVCNTCDAEYQEKSLVKEHLKTHEVMYKCDVCSRIFTSAYKYSTHRILHSDDNTFRCVLCDYSNARRTCLLTHINITHLKKFLYNCSTCGKGFNDVVLHKEHEVSHTGGPCSFECIVCRKKFMYSRYLLQHQVRLHRVSIEGVLLPNQCMACGKKFSFAKSLERHMKNTHSNKAEEKPQGRTYLCDICGKACKAKDKLDIHTRTHTGVKPFACKHCGKAFTNKTSQVIHERVHTGEKPYSCEFCGKCFTQSSTLLLHRRRHTGENPYSCNFCGSGFPSRVQLNLHKNSCMIDY